MATLQELIDDIEKELSNVTKESNKRITYLKTKLQDKDPTRDANDIYNEIIQDIKKESTINNNSSVYNYYTTSKQFLDERSKELTEELDKEKKQLEDRKNALKNTDAPLQNEQQTLVKIQQEQQTHPYPDQSVIDSQQKKINDLTAQKTALDKQQSESDKHIKELEKHIQELQTTQKNLDDIKKELDTSINKALEGTTQPRPINPKDAIPERLKAFDKKMRQEIKEIKDPTKQKEHETKYDKSIATTKDEGKQELHAIADKHKIILSEDKNNDVIDNLKKQHFQSITLSPYELKDDGSKSTITLSSSEDLLKAKFIDIDYTRKDGVSDKITAEVIPNKDPKQIPTLELRTPLKGKEEDKLAQLTAQFTAIKEFRQHYADSVKKNNNLKDQEKSDLINNALNAPITIESLPHGEQGIEMLKLYMKTAEKTGINIQASDRVKQQIKDLVGANKEDNLQHIKEKFPLLHLLLSGMAKPIITHEEYKKTITELDKLGPKPTTPTLQKK